jgi:hypothetical protein
MSTTSIFGQDLTDYDIEIIIENPAIAAWFEGNRRRQAVAERWHYDRSVRGRMMNLLKTAAKATGTIQTVRALIGSNQPTERGERSGNLRNDFETPQKGKRPVAEISPELPEKKKSKNSASISEFATNTMGDVEMMSSSMVGGESKIGKETPVDRQNPHYGLPDTTTVVLPYTTYFSVVTPADQSVVTVRLRVNSPYDPLVSGLAADPINGSALAAGRYRTKVKTDGFFWSDPLQYFPVQNATGSSTADIPQWRTYFDKLYNKYTVLRCDYEITYQNPIEKRAYDAVVAYGIDAFSTANDGRKFPTNANLQALEYWPDLKWAIVKSSAEKSDDGTWTTIKGSYVPGTAERNVQNDEDIKTWTTIGSTPSLTEELTLFHGNAGFNEKYVHIGVHVRVKLKYVVQFKDKTVNLRYPHGGQSDIEINVPTDILRTS